MPLDTVTSFTPVASLLGGVLIGLAAVAVMAVFGRISGISGITTGAIGAVVPVRDTPADLGWRVAFIAGLIAAPLLVWALSGTAPQQTVPDNLGGMAAGGILVGLGTALGAGCTSGHGVCGLARLSPRSAVAVVTFMTTAAATVFLLRHVI